MQIGFRTVGSALGCIVESEGRENGKWKGSRNEREESKDKREGGDGRVWNRQVLASGASLVVRF